MRRPASWACNRSAMRSARRRPFGAVGMPPEREQREVALRDDVGVVARPPELRERRVLPRRRLDPVDARVQREQRGPRHAVLQPGPRRPPQRLGPVGSRSSSPPTRRLNARICCRVSRSREGTDLPATLPERAGLKGLDTPGVRHQVGSSLRSLIREKVSGDALHFWTRRSPAGRSAGANPELPADRHNSPP